MNNVRQMMEDIISAQLKAIVTEVNAIQSRAPKTPAQYTDKRGETHYECPGAYNDYMTRAMASDMFWFYPVFQIKYPELAEYVIQWAKKMTDRNYQLMRMFDDSEGDRPMRPWSQKRTYKFMKEIHSTVVIAKQLYKENNDAMLKDFIGRCIIWAKRIMYMNTHAFCLQNADDIDRTLFESQIEMFDGNGHKISGLDKNEQILIKTLCNIRTKMTTLLTSVPVDSHDHNYLMEKLNIFDQMGQIIMHDSN